MYSFSHILLECGVYMLLTKKAWNLQQYNIKTVESTQLMEPLDTTCIPR